MTVLDPAKLVFIDEIGFGTKMIRRCERFARGAPCIGAVPHGHWRKNTFIAGLRVDRLDTPMLTQGTMDGHALHAWVKQAFAPPLKQGGIVICDNLNVHKNDGTCAVIENCLIPRFDGVIFSHNGRRSDTSIHGVMLTWQRKYR